MKKHNAKYITETAVIAALYVVFTYLSSIFGLDKGVIQLRLSESLVALLAFTGAAVPGLTIGCLIANLLTGSVVIDIVVGPIATFIGAIVGRLIKKHTYAVLLPNIISNTVIIPFILKYAYGTEGALPFFFVTVGAGEVISSGVFGAILIFWLKKYEKIIFRQI